MEKAHAKFSASGSERWLSCAASISLSEKAPKPKESQYAAEGTLAHSYFEKALTTKSVMSGTEKEMIGHAIKSAEWVQNQRGEENLLVETKVDLSFVHPDTWGTVDAAIVREFGRLTVIDYKYGAGIPVEPEENSQLIFYALGLSARYDHNFSDVEIVIIQPRAEHEAGPIRSWVISIEDLLKWEAKFKAGIKASLAPNPEATAGDWCRFCPAAVICPALGKDAFKSAQADFSEETGELVTSPMMQHKRGVADVERLSKVLLAADKIETWL